jgi:hypothetical protein
MNEETWKDIDGFVGYQVSDWGRVRSNLKSGEWQILKPQILKKTNKYRVACIGLWAARKYCKKPIHRLVLEVFVGVCPDGYVCCHNDGDALNNRLENLRWDTPAANKRDSIKHGSYRGENAGRSKVTEKQVLKIRRLYREGTSRKRLAKRYGLSYGGLSKIVTYVSWKHLP